MQVISIEPLASSKKRRRICLESGQSFVLYAGEVRRIPGMEEGGSISEEEYQRIRSEILLPRAKKRTLHLLERFDRTRADLLGKLTSSGYPEDIAEEAIDYAASYGYVDDRRYCSNYIFFHQEKKSRRNLIDYLLKKGIGRDLIEECLEEAELTSEEEKIRALLTKRHFDPEEADAKEKAKTIRYLMGRGFSYEKVREAMRGAWRIDEV